MATENTGKPVARDTVNWERALEQHHSWLRTVVLSRVDEPQAVDDVMQEISLAVVRQRQPLVDASKLASWLYQLAVKQSLLYRRSQGRRRRLNNRYGAWLGQTDQDHRPLDLLAWVTAEERRELVHKALRQLPRRDVEILLLKYVHGWSYEQVTEHLGISHSAVANRLRRARVRLRDQLARLEIYEAAP
jgi:RNA polymerase sigma-70 factor (ECF subfamily)